jgi:hypothetical protein
VFPPPSGPLTPAPFVPPPPGRVVNLEVDVVAKYVEKLHV